MRSLVVVPFAALAVVVANTGCAQAPRAFEGKVEKGTTAVLAIDAQGNSFRALPAANLTFHLEVASSEPVRVFALKQSGVVQTLVFAAKPGAPKTASLIPNKDGTIKFGALSTCDCSGNGSPETTPEDNPLKQCDSDNDGVDDYDSAGASHDGNNEHQGGDSNETHTGDTGSGETHDGSGDTGSGETHDGSGDTGTGDSGETHDGDNTGDTHEGDTGSGDTGSGDSGSTGGDSGGDGSGDSGSGCNGGDSGSGSGDAGSGDAGGEGEGEGEGDSNTDSGSGEHH